MKLMVNNNQLVNNWMVNDNQFILFYYKFKL